MRHTRRQRAVPRATLSPDVRASLRKGAAVTVWLLISAVGTVLLAARYGAFGTVSAQVLAQSFLLVLVLVAAGALLRRKLLRPASVEVVHTVANQPTNERGNRSRPASIAQGRPAADDAYRTSSQVANLAAHSASLGGARIYAASAVGRHHRVADCVREDAFALASSRAEAGAVAVADGVGSSRHAHAAAQIAARIAAEKAAAWVVSPSMGWRDSALQIIETISAVLRDEEYVASRSLLEGRQRRLSADRGAAPATTLAVAAFRTRGADLEVFWLVYGDTAVLRLDPSGWGPVSDFQANKLDTFTSALPGDGAPLRCESLRLRPNEYLLLASDGYADLFAELAQQIQPRMHKVISEGGSAASFSLLVETDAPGLDDDKTAVVITPATGVR